MGSKFGWSPLGVLANGGGDGESGMMKGVGFLTFGETLRRNGMGAGVVRGKLERIVGFDGN